MKKELLFLCWNAYGDFLSYNGMIRFLLKYFDKIYIRVNGFTEYLNDMFKDVCDRVILISHHDALNKVITDKTLPVLNTIQTVDFDRTGVISKIDSYELKEHVRDDMYFNGKNRLMDWLQVESESYKTPEFVDNSSNFYVNLGLDPSIKWSSFNYERRLDDEIAVANRLKHANNVSSNYVVTSDNPYHRIRNDFQGHQVINIDNCTDNPLKLMHLLENADEIHLIDNSNTLFAYYMCMSGLVKLKNVNVHIYSRNRFPYYYMMFMNPPADGWHYIME